MNDYTVTVNLQSVKLGDSWVGLDIGPVPVTGITQGTLSRISMVFVGPGSPIVFQLDSDAGYDGSIAITDPVTWVAVIDPVFPFLNRVGDWKWDMKFYHDGDVSPITGYEGVIKIKSTTDP